jgi:hypothetical protein
MRGMRRWCSMEKCPEITEARHLRATRRTRAECADEDYRAAIIDIATIGSDDRETWKTAPRIPFHHSWTLDRERSLDHDHVITTGPDRADRSGLIDLSRASPRKSQSRERSRDRTIENHRLSLRPAISGWFLGPIVTSLKHKRKPRVSGIKGQSLTARARRKYEPAASRARRAIRDWNRAGSSYSGIDGKVSRYRETASAHWGALPHTVFMRNLRHTPCACADPLSQASRDRTFAR